MITSVNRIKASHSSIDAPAWKPTETVSAAMPAMVMAASRQSYAGVVNSDISRHSGLSSTQSVRPPQSPNSFSVTWARSAAMPKADPTTQWPASWKAARRRSSCSLLRSSPAAWAETSRSVKNLVTSR